jgi:NitT/TauT family transport system substrate-binding protein
MRRLRLLPVLLLLLLASCMEAPQPPLRVGAVLWPWYEPLYLAGRLGYYKPDEIKLIDYLSNVDAMLAFRNNLLDAGAFTLDEALQLIASGADVQIVLIMDVSHGGDVIMANPEIKTMQDLKGKSIAVETTAVGSLVLARALQVHNIDPDDVKVVTTNAMEQIEAFSNGNIDAAVSFDPNRSHLLEMGKHEIFNSTEIPNEIIDLLVVRKEAIENNRKMVAHLVDSWFRALEYQSRYPLESAAFSVDRHKIAEQQYVENLKRLKFASRAENLLLLDAKNSPLLEHQHMLSRILLDLGLIAKAPDLNGHLDAEFIKP